ncbi:hypothetical protein D3C75_244690 [compost metagenome]
MKNPDIKASNTTATESADTAWIKMQQQLADEPVNPVWDSWGLSTGPDRVQEDAGRLKNYAPDLNAADGQKALPVQASADEKPVITSTRRKLRMTRGRRWAAAASAAALLAVVLATPVGNTAMAAILNQFRMQEVTIVNETDIRDLFNLMNDGGTFSEAQNKFGSFTTTSGTFYDEVPIDQLQSIVGYSAMNAGIKDVIQSVQVSSARDATMTLKVDVLNQTLKRLGAEQLLPSSLDGKQITLHLPETVNYDLTTPDGKWASLSQMNTPTIIVDQSIDVNEALQSILNLPFLPHQWKTTLQQSQVLAGEIPLPLIKGQQAEEITIADTQVILQQFDYSQGAVFTATWARDGQLFELHGGSHYPNKEEFIQKLQELIEE